MISLSGTVVALYLELRQRSSIRAQRASKLDAQNLSQLTDDAAAEQ
jgi:hypothetical protein